MFSIMALLARLTGAEQFGIFVFVIAWLNIVTLVAKMGLDTTVVRYASQYQSQEEFALWRGLLHRSSSICLMSSLLCTGIGVLIVKVISIYLSNDFRMTFFIACVILPIAALSSIRQAALQALGYAVRAQAPELIIKPIFFLIFFMLFYWVQNNKGLMAQDIMMANLAACSVAFLWGVFWLNHYLPDKVKNCAPSYATKEWITVAIPMIAVLGANSLINLTDTIIVGMILGSKEAGVYSVASRIAVLMQFGVNALQIVAAPMIASFYTQKNYAELQKLLHLTAIGGVAFALPIWIGLLIWAKAVLSLFGAEFAVGYSALIILGFAQLANAFTGLTGLVMTMTGHQVFFMKVLAGSALSNIVIMVLFVYLWGIIGASLATSITIILWNLIIAIHISRNLNFHTTPFKLKGYGFSRKILSNY